LKINGQTERDNKFDFPEIQFGEKERICPNCESNKMLPVKINGKIHHIACLDCNSKFKEI
jgi:hypothetical protein